MKRKQNKALKTIFILLILLVTLLSKLIITNTKTTTASKEPTTQTKENKNLTIHYLDVGQGDSIFIELPTKETILIDAGEKNKGKYVLEYIKKLNYNQIDYLIATHPHTDHIGGLGQIIDNLEIKNIYMPKVSTTSTTYKNLLQKIKNKNLTITTAKKGKTLIDNNELNIKILSPIEDKYNNINNYSVVLKITYQKTSFIFMGDIEEVEKTLDKKELKSDVIKIAHHGSDTSSSKEFIKNVSAQIGIIQVGEDNPYKHPNENICKSWQNNKTTIYRTDKHGTIKVISNGEKLTVEKEK